MSLFKTKDGFSINGRASLLHGTDAPNTGAGVVAPLSSLYLRSTGSSAELWQKIGASDTNWELVASDLSSEDPFQNAYMGKTSGSVLPQYGTPSVVANNDTLVSALTKIDTKIGANPTPVSRTTSPIVATDPVQTNIDKLDSAIGSDLTNTNYAKNNQTVNQNISAIDGQVKTNSDAIASIQTGQKWITPMKFITSENLSGRSGLAQFTDDQVPYTFPVAGDRVVSTADNKLYIASAGVWSAGTALTAGDTFFVDNDLLQTSAVNEKASAYTFNGSAMIRQASFDFEAADTINLTGAYTVSSGDPSPSDSVQKAISNIDGNVDALTSTMGVSQGHTNLGTWTGTGATRILANASETAKTAIQKVANEIGGLAGGQGDYVSNQAVNPNLNAIDTILTQALKKIAVSNVPTDTEYVVDTLDLSGDIRFVEWDVTIIQSTTPANRYSCKIRGMASTGGSDFTEYAILTIGTTIGNVVFSVDSSTLNATTLKVQASVTGGFNVKIVRRTGLVA